MIPADLGLTCVNSRLTQPWQSGGDFRIILMRRFAVKAVFTALTVNRAEKRRPDWDRIILIVSTSVTAGLVVLYAYGKATSRW
jgi:hypothetical protein